MSGHIAKPHLLPIPGLGDRVWLYRTVVPLWRSFGYDVHVHAFGWNGGLVELEKRQERLLDHVEDLPLDRLHVIGASAGGVATVNLLAERPAIRRVVVVAAPLCPKDIPTKQLLVAAFKQSDSFLSGSPAQVKRKLLSVHGVYDNRVPVELSRRPGVQNVQIPKLGHGPTILSALTIHSGDLRRFFR